MARNFRLARLLLKLLAWLVAVPLGLVLLVLVAIYLPPVQDWGVALALDKVNSGGALKVSVDRLRLKFPLRLEVDRAVVVQASGDTMVDVASLRTRISPLALLAGRIDAPVIDARRVYYQLNNPDSLVWLTARVDSAHISSGGINLKFDDIHVGSIALDGARVRLDIRRDTVAPPPDTAAVKPSPLRVKVGRAELRRIEYAMRLEGVIDSLGASLPRAVFDAVSLDMATHDIHAEAMEVDSVSAAYIHPAVIVPSPVAEPEIAEAPAAEPWRVTASRLRLTGRQALYATGGHRPLPGLDMDWIEASAIDIAVDSFENRGATLRVPLRRFKARERCGVTLDATGLFAIDSTAMSASNFHIATDYSTLSLDALMGMGDLAADPSLPLRLKAAGTLGLDDAALAFPAMKGAVGALPVPRQIKTAIDANGTAGALRLATLSLDYPGLLRLAASGTVDNPFNARHLSGKLHIDGRVTQADRLLRGKGAAALVGVTLDPSIALPATLTLKGTVAYSPGPKAQADIALTADADGRLALKGSWQGAAETYDATLDLNNFPVNAFMPTLGVGAVTGHIMAQGHGYNPLDPKSRLDLKADVVSVAYNHLILRDINLEATAGDGRAEGCFLSANPAADLDLDFSAASTDSGYTWQADAQVNHIDLRALGLTTDTLDGSGRIVTAGVIDPRTRALRASVDATGLDLTLGTRRLVTDGVKVDARLADSLLTASLVNGDLRLNLAADCPLDTLTRRLGGIGELVDSQMRRRDIDILALQRALPPMRGNLEMGSNNLAAEWLRDSGTSLGHAALTFSNDSLLRFTAGATGLRSGSIAIDSLALNAMQHGSYLAYSLRADNAPGTMDQLAHVTANGFMGSNRLTLMLNQSDIKGQTGFRLGLNALTADSTITLRLTPATPVIAYRDWRLNPDNHITYNFFNHRIDANLDMQGDRSSVSILTEPPADPSRKNNDILVRLGNIRLQDWLTVNPFAPPWEGNLSTDLRVNLGADIVGKGTVTLDSLYYGHRRVGNFLLDMDVANSPVTGLLTADMALTVDSVKTMTLRGVLNDTTAQASPYMLDFNMFHFPLSVANPFLPPATASLEGTLEGSMKISGDKGRPLFNGWLRFDSAAVNVAMLGSRFGFSDTKIPVDSSLVHFNNWQIASLNDKPLSIDGTVDIADLANIGIDLSLFGADMLVVDAQRARGAADVYGKAWVDLSASARGNMRFMRVNADAALLEGSNVTYVLAGGTQSLQLAGGDSQMVKFVNFNDTAQVVQADSLHRSLAMLLEARLDIRQGTTLQVDLSTDGKNKAQLQGYGSLDYSLNPMNSGRLTGRYTIDKGFVRYTPPLMSEKYFTFEEGSFVAFNGDILNPILNLHATDRIRANVTQTGENSRLVNFDVGIAVTNSLQNMHVAFDLSTDDDITVENELQSMSADQRANQAMNLLLYGVYTGAGTTGNANIGGNALFAFLGSKLNSWASEVIPWVDISFGMNQYERTYDGSTSLTTSYNYEVSKSLFNDRFKIVVGGNFTPDTQADENFSQNIINNISFEYLLNRQGTMYVRIFRHTGYESILEGEVTKTGVGFVVKRKLNSLFDFFGRRRRKAAAAAADDDDGNRQTVSDTPQPRP